MTSTSAASESPQRRDARPRMSVETLIAGHVCVSPELPYGNGCGLLKGSGLLTPKSRRVWLPVCSFLVSTPHGRILVDAGWDRSMSPAGRFDASAQQRSLGSWLLYKVNQGVVRQGQTVPEQLAQRGIEPSDLDAVVVTHLDCDHANGLMGLTDVPRVLVSRPEMRGASELPGDLVRFRKQWWEHAPVVLYDWNGTDGPVHHSYDLYGDGIVTFIHTPGHTNGHVAVKVTEPRTGRFVLLFGDAGYSTCSWKHMITSGIAVNRKEQRASLEWIRTMSENPLCIRSMAAHDTDNRPGIIEF